MTQQVFLNAIKSISSFRWRGMRFSAWLYRIAHNQIVDHLRKKSKNRTLPLIDSLPIADDDDPREELERKVEIEELSLATKRLTKAQQEVISLRFTGEMPVAEVARIMGKSEGAIKALQHSAIVALRKVLLTG
jgi:RNA polymerase sigma-70 factor (ECF subfamily)